MTGELANRVAELTRCRAAAGLSEEDSLIWFGVGRATIERIESGEVQPEPEILERIDRFLKFAGGTADLAGVLPRGPFRGLPDRPNTHSGGPPSGGSADATQSGLSLAARSDSVPAAHLDAFAGGPIPANRRPL